MDKIVVKADAAINKTGNRNENKYPGKYFRIFVEKRSEFHIPFHQPINDAAFYFCLKT